MTIDILKEDVVSSFSAGATVATATADGGTSPYIYSLATGSEYFNIDSSTGIITVIAEMNIDNIKSFSVTVTDSTTSTAQTVTSNEIYPNTEAKIQSRFKSADRIYKITQNIDLGHGVLTIPSSSTLDFQGGKFINGAIKFNNTRLLPPCLEITDYISNTINEDYRRGQTVYDSSLEKMKLWNGSAWVNLDGTALE